MKVLHVALMIGTLSLLGASHDDRAINTLIGAKQIETYKIYESAERSKLAEALTTVLREDDPRPALLEIFKRSGRGAGRIYALVGLHHTDRKLYDEYVKELKPTEIVEGQWFGLVRNMSVKEWLTMIESGELYQNVVLDRPNARSK
jgi:hypothetical protein